MVVKPFKIERSVKVERAVCRYLVTQRRSVLKVGSAGPAVGCIIVGIRVDPVEYRNKIQRQLIRHVERLVIVKRASKVLYTCPHRIFPCRILVGIEVFVYRRVRFFYLGMCGTVEVHVEILGQVPAYRELTVPQELLAEGQRQLIAVGAFHVALLKFIIVAQHFRIERYVLRQPVKTEVLHDVIPLTLALYHLLERLEGLVDRSVAVVDGSAPVVFVLIDGCLAARVAVTVAVREREVSRVVRHGVTLSLYSDTHIRQ